MYIIYHLEKKRITADTLNVNTTPKECAVTAIIAMVEPKNLGTVLMRSYMPMECAKIVISTATIKKEEKREHRRSMSLKYKISEVN